MATVTESTTTAMSLPVACVEPGQPLVTVYAHLDGWVQFEGALQALERREARPRLAYAHQMPESPGLLSMLVLNAAP